MGEAREYHQGALEMCQTLYPKARYPLGHPNLATCLNNLGYILWRQGNAGEGRKYLQQALEMDEALHPKERYPQGHPSLASSLNNLGGLLEAQGNYKVAREYYDRAGDEEGVVSQGSVPSGPSSLGSRLQQPGACFKPRATTVRGGYCERAVEMLRALYSRRSIPRAIPIWPLA